jgi:hypothetical protein
MRGPSSVSVTLPHLCDPIVHEDRPPRPVLNTREERGRRVGRDLNLGGEKGRRRREKGDEGLVSSKTCDMR